MIQDHTVNILDWIQYEKVKWLQIIPCSFVMNDELWNLMPVYDSARRQIWDYL